MATSQKGISDGKASLVMREDVPVRWHRVDRYKIVPLAPSSSIIITTTRRSTRASSQDLKTPKPQAQSLLLLTSILQSAIQLVSCSAYPVSLHMFAFHFSPTFSPIHGFSHSLTVLYPVYHLFSRILKANSKIPVNR